MDDGGYLLGGTNLDFDSLKEIHFYDFGDETWDTQTDLLHHGLIFAGAGTDGSLIMQLGGGYYASAGDGFFERQTEQTQIFHPGVGGDAVSGPSLNFPRGKAKAAFVDNVIYVFGGSDSPITGEKILLPE